MMPHTVCGVGYGFCAHYKQFSVSEKVFSGEEWLKKKMDVVIPGESSYDGIDWKDVN